jgi:hypothetical protein
VKSKNKNIVPDEHKVKFKNKNIVPVLTKIAKYVYDDNGKLISIEYNNITDSTSHIIQLQYNERGLVSKDASGDIIEYEYYDF